MRYRNIITITAAIFLLAVATASGDQFDRPVAVVGKTIILESELQAQVQIYALQNKVDVNNPRQLAQLRENILNQMIDDRLILTEAEKDTTISVEAEEIEQALTDHIANLRAQFADDAAFEAELQREGLNISELRRRFRQDTGNQLLKQKLINQKLGTVSVTNGEVREFFAKYADSLPEQPASARLAHILTPIMIDTNRILQTRDRLTHIREEISNGLDFAEAAKQYSDDPTAQIGGELGWFGPGDLVVEFETAARKLEPGQLSGVVRTPYGYHLIEVMDKQGNRFRARHILLRLQGDAADSAAAWQLSDSLLTAIRGGVDFCDVVREYTADKESQKNCGELGWYPLAQMYPEFQEALKGAKPGDLAGPAKSEFGVHILKVLDRKESRDYSLEEDWDAIKQMARREKTNRVVNEWIAGIRAETYVEIKKF